MTELCKIRIRLYCAITVILFYLPSQCFANGDCKIIKQSDTNEYSYNLHQDECVVEIDDLVNIGKAFKFEIVSANQQLINKVTDEIISARPHEFFNNGVYSRAFQSFIKGTVDNAGKAALMTTLAKCGKDAWDIYMNPAKQDIWSWIFGQEERVWSCASAAGLGQVLVDQAGNAMLGGVTAGGAKAMRETQVEQWQFVPDQ